LQFLCPKLPKTGKMVTRRTVSNPLCALAISLFLCYIGKRGNKMGTRVKPVQLTEIKDKKIVYQVIQEIRRKPTAAALKRHKAEEEAFMRLLKK
jgi:hypothetical protein